MIGPGKYDDACTVARESTGARGVVLIVVDGHAGSGFSCQMQGGPADVKQLAAVLRFIADEMDTDDAAVAVDSRHVRCAGCGGARFVVAARVNAPALITCAKCGAVVP